MKSLYGLADSGDNWHATLAQHLSEDLELVPNPVDTSHHFKNRRPRPTHRHQHAICWRLTPRRHASLSGSLPRSERKGSKRRPMAHYPSRLPGTKLTNHPKERYSSIKASILESSRSYRWTRSTQFRSMRMKLAWMANSRPDALFNISQIAQSHGQYFRRRTVQGD